MTITADNNDAENRYGKPPSRLAAYSFYVGAVMVAIASAAVLIAKCANAQTTEPTAPTASTQAASSATAPAAPQVLAKASPRYSARDIERAFNFMDAN